MSRVTTIDVPLPLGGVDSGRAYEKQRPGTSAAAQNARPFDPATDRVLMAQRPGMVKAVDDQVDGGDPIYGVAGVRVQQTRERLEVNAATFTDDFDEGGSGTSVDSLGNRAGGGSDDWVLYEGTVAVGPSVKTVILGAASSATWLGSGTPGPQVHTNDAYRDQLTTQDSGGSTGEQAVWARLDRGDTGVSVPSGGFGLEIEFTTQASINANNFAIGLWCYGSATESEFTSDQDGAFFAGIVSASATVGPLVFHAANIGGVSGITGWTGNIGVATPSSQQPTPDGRLQTGLLSGAGGIQFDGDYAYFSTSTTYTLRLLVKDRYFELYLKEGAGAFALLSFGELRDECDPTNPEFGFFARNVGGTAADHFLASVDNFRLYSLNQKSLNAPEDKIITVEGGEIFVSTDGAAFAQATGQPEALDSTGEVTAIVGPPLPDEPVDVRYVYFLDGSKYQRLDVFGEVVSEWTARADDAMGSYGSMPGDDSGVRCRYAVAWRNRCVMFGLDSDPTNWFMSRIGEWDDWNFTPATPDGAQAVAGSAEAQVRNIEAITAMIPYTADYLLMAGAESLQLMRGDPADGGSVDLLTSRSGVVGARAWAMDPYGTVYYMGPDGLYAIRPTVAEPEPLSQGRIDQYLRGCELINCDVRLAYEPRNDGLHIWVRPTSGSDVILWWDRRTNSFQPDAYASANHFPASHAYFGYAGGGASRATLLLGHRDGYVRSFDNSAKDDDGTAIDSWALVGPTLAQPGKHLRVREVRVRTADTNDLVTVKLRAGSSAERAFDSTPRASKTYSSSATGMLTPMRRAVGGSAVYVEVGNDQADSRWAVEGIELAVEGGGAVRRAAR